MTGNLITCARLLWS